MQTQCFKAENVSEKKPEVMWKSHSSKKNATPFFPCGPGKGFILCKMHFPLCPLPLPSAVSLLLLGCCCGAKSWKRNLFKVFRTHVNGQNLLIAELKYLFLLHNKALFAESFSHRLCSSDEWKELMEGKQADSENASGARCVFAQEACRGMYRAAAPLPMHVSPLHQKVHT